MSEEDKNRAWRDFEQAVIAAHGSFPPLISAIHDRDPEQIRLCLRLAGENNGLFEMIPRPENPAPEKPAWEVLSQEYYG